MAAKEHHTSLTHASRDQPMMRSAWSIRKLCKMILQQVHERTFQSRASAITCHLSRRYRPYCGTRLMADVNDGRHDGLSLHGRRSRSQSTNSPKKVCNFRGTISFLNFCFRTPFIDLFLSLSSVRLQLPFFSPTCQLAFSSSSYFTI